MPKNYDLDNWSEDLRDLFMKAGVEDKKIAFIIRDTDIKYEVFIENINNILNTGEVPNLF